MQFLRRRLSFSQRRRQRPEGQNGTGVNEQGQGEPEKEKSIIIHFLGIFTEYLFVILPLIAIIVFSGFPNDLSDLFSTAELSFAASILFGQTIVKIASGFSIHSRVEAWEPVALIIALLIVIGLVPSVIVLAIILSQGQQASIFLQRSQAGLFILASLLFIILGSYSAQLNYEGQFDKAREIVAKETEPEVAV